MITQGSSTAAPANDGQQITSKEPTETDAIIASLKVTADNAEIISSQMAEIVSNINGGKGTLGRLIQDRPWPKMSTKPLLTLKKQQRVE